MEWTREKTLMLIDEYQKRRGLWDMTHEDYRKKCIKRQLLNEVAEKVNMKVPTNEIEKKFHTLRTQYHREINRMKQFPGDEYKSKWFAFRHLEFLSSPKACRGSKSDSKGEKLNIKKESCSPATYIIKQLQQEHESSYNGMDVKQETQRLVQHDQHSTTATEYLSVPKKNIANKRDISESRKDFEKLIQETTKDVEEIEEDIDQSDYKLRMKAIPVQNNYTAQNIQTIEHYIDEQDEDQSNTQDPNSNASILHHDDNEYHSNAPSTIIRIQKRDLGAIDKLYEDSYETKKTKCNVLYSGVRDEYAIYGEYVANEMRMITAKEVLINLKHKINLALFEANMSQLNKERV
ncbi:uncharacterized protein LOC129617268 [Condylostylus longicornis]|uniref:uncharacterized protein LOC129617268 n=1 Tax=Condylostylus longicornis TaxID=2530218 RepID=UPI00244DC5E6|nr:uncharacterized protein LOC129617268 [Condylostylus longicornis]